MYYTYLLRCKDGSLYAGITTNLIRRLAEHQGSGGKGAKYTRTHPPLEMAAAWQSVDRSAASRLEVRLKALPKREKEALLTGETPAALDLTEYVRLPAAQLPKVGGASA